MTLEDLYTTLKELYKEYEYLNKIQFSQMSFDKLDAAVRTVKDMLYLRIFHFFNEKFKEIIHNDFPTLIEDVVHNYNNKPHSGKYNFTPNQISGNNAIQ